MKKNFEKLFAKWYWPLVILAVVGFILYGRALSFGFTYLDDNVLVLNNQTFLTNWSNIIPAFEQDVFHLFDHSASYYRPLLTLSFMLDAHIGGTSPVIYHLTNIVLHVLAGWLVYLFLKKLRYAPEISFLLALVFLVHPSLSQAVAWVPGRNDSLLVILILTSFNFFIDFLETKKRTDLFWHVFFFALAIFTKETALFVLPVFVFYIWFIRKDLGIFFRQKILGATWIAVLVFWFILRHFALQSDISLSVPAMIKSILVNAPGSIQLLGKVFFPVNLSVLPIMRDTTYFYGAAALVLLAILFFLTRKKRWDYLLFGLFWFAIFLFPAFIRPDPTAVSDFIEHRLYLPIIGLFIFILELQPLICWRPDRKKYLWPSVMITIALAVLTFQHISVFHDQLAFWQNAAANSPDYPLAWRNLGAMCYLDGDMNNAEIDFKKALALHPTEEMAHNNLGLIYAARHQDAAAEKEYQAEIAVNPYYDAVYYNLGLLYYGEGKTDQAADEWRKTISINPDYSDALYNLAELDLSRKNYAEAAGCAERLAAIGAPLPPNLSALLDPLTLMQLESNKN